MCALRGCMHPEHRGDSAGATGRMLVVGSGRRSFGRLGVGRRLLLDRRRERRDIGHRPRARDRAHEWSGHRVDRNTSATAVGVYAVKASRSRAFPCVLRRGGSCILSLTRRWRNGDDDHTRRLPRGADAAATAASFDRITRKPHAAEGGRSHTDKPHARALSRVVGCVDRRSRPVTPASTIRDDGGEIGGPSRNASYRG